MLGKLLKDELKASARTFLPLYLALIVVSIIAAVSGKTTSLLAQGISGFVMGGLFISLIVLTIMVIIQRFSKNLLEDEGYLMFTLPVSSKKLIISKCLSSCIYGALSFIVAMIVLFIIMVSTGGFEVIRFMPQAFGELFKWLFNFENMLDLLILMFTMILGFASFIVLIYFVLSLGQLPAFNKHRKLVAFTAFIAIMVVLSILQSVLGEFIPGINNSMYMYTDTPVYNHLYNNPGMLSVLGWTLAQVLAFFFGTSYILDNKLNLE